MSGVMLQIILDTVTCCGCCCYRLHSDVQEEDGQVGAERQHPQHTQVDGADYEHLTSTKLQITTFYIIIAGMLC